MSEELFEAVVDFATAIEAAAVGFKQRVARLHGVGLKEESFLSLLGWTRSQGERLGEFEYCTREANNNSDAFNHAFNILKANDATIKNHLSEKHWRYYYWIWPERGDTIYRKLRKGKEPAPRAEVDVIAQVKAKFPPDLERLLTFSREGDFIVVKPRGYLGSESFAKIAAIIREAGGEYLSLGKASHFRLKRGA